MQQDLFEDEAFSELDLKAFPNEDETTRNYCLFSEGKKEDNFS